MAKKPTAEQIHHETLETNALLRAHATLLNLSSEALGKAAAEIEEDHAGTVS